METLELINEIVSKLNFYDKKEIEVIFKIIIKYCDESGNNIHDVKELLYQVIENI